MQCSSEYRIQFEKAYIHYYSRMKRFAQEYVIREEDAENIVHDVFTEFWEKKVDFTVKQNFNGYIFVVLKNKCIDFLRHQTTEEKIKIQIQDQYTQLLNLKLDSLEALNNKLLSDPDMDAIIQQAINNLPEKCRQIFLMNKVEGKKQKHIAKELNISINTVESQMAIAYKKLKEELKDFAPLLILLFI